MLWTEEEITSLQRRITPIDGDCSCAEPSVASSRSMCLPICSALREIGVSGFLISCATRRATSFQALCFCARSSSVAFSSTIT
jgi:hypothetical protein